MHAYNPKTEQLEFIAGDKVVQQDYADARPGEFIPELAGLVGRSNTVRLDKAAIGHPLIRYRDFVIEADVYPLLGAAAVAGALPALEVIIICPRCQHELSIKSDRKDVHYVPGAPELDEHTHQAVVRGTISVEKFQCTWELDTAQAVTGSATGDARRSSDNLCRWRVAIDRNIARDA